MRNLCKKNRILLSLVMSIIIFTSCTGGMEFAHLLEHDRGVKYYHKIKEEDYYSLKYIGKFEAFEYHILQWNYGEKEIDRDIFEHINTNLLNKILANDANIITDLNTTVIRRPSICCIPGSSIIYSSVNAFNDDKLPDYHIKNDKKVRKESSKEAKEKPKKRDEKETNTKEYNKPEEFKFTEDTVDYVKPIVIKRVEPDLSSLKSNESGMIKGVLDINAFGTVTNVDITKGLTEEIDDICKRELKKMKFEPATQKGKNIPFKLDIYIKIVNGQVNYISY